MTHDNPKWMDEVRKIVSQSDLAAPPEPGTSSFYRDVQRMIARSVFRDAPTLRAHSNSLFLKLSEDFKKAYPDKTTMVKDENSGERKHDNGAITINSFRSVPFIEDPTEQQFGEVVREGKFSGGESDIHVLGGIYSHPNHIARSEIQYTIQLSKRNNRLGSSSIKVEIDLQGDYAIDIAYECDENGIALVNPRRKDWNLANVGCYKNGEWYEPDADFVNQAKDFLIKYGFLDK